MEPSNSYSQWRPHPWHGLGVGPRPPEIVHAYIEITPFDLVKYEVDKETGYLRVDRPQRSSSQPPALYGFIPRTYCGKRVSAFAARTTDGDNDPLDICVISERPITKSEVVLNAKVVGGLRMIDGDEVDDKMIAVLANDTLWGMVDELAALPDVLIERIRHYFSTYKLIPGQESKVWIEDLYGKDHALKVVAAAIEDYHETFKQ